MKLLFGPAPHQDASDFIKDKPVVSRAVFQQMVPEVRARTFLVSGMVPLDIAQKLRDRIAELPQGADWSTLKADIAGSLSPFFEHPGPEAGGGTVDRDEARAAAERRAELLLRTHGYQAYAASQYRVMERQRDVFPYWRYQTAQDDRVREAHAALEGVVLPANDPFWQTHFPPWDFNCRCTVVPLSDADVAEIQQEDAQKPADQRSILSEQQRARMNTDGALVRGPNRIVDVRSPRQKRDGDGYAWQPSDLRIPLSTLKERYSPEVWSAFETFAKSAQLADGRTVHAWLEGAAPPPVVLPPPPTVPPVAVTPPAPAAIASPTPSESAPPVATPATPVRARPVSGAFALGASRSAAVAPMRAALVAIDRVHDDGALPAMQLVSRTKRNALGHFDRFKREIAVRPNGLWPQLTATHEAGHMLDAFVFGSGAHYGSETAAEFAAWRKAVSESAAIRGIKQGIASGRPIYQASYYLRAREIWARSYAQYIATRSGDATMLEQLNTLRAVPQVGTLIQWSDEDFKPIAAAIDDLFKAKGWIS